MKETLKLVIEDAKALLYDSTSMMLDCICEKLYFDHHINAEFYGRSIYVNSVRVASISPCKEGKNIVGIYGYKILI